MRPFISKLIIFLFPLLAIIFLYVRADPYFDFFEYENLSWTYSFQELGDISTKKLLKTDIEYNSFILGSSRTVSAYACYMEKEIKGAKFFHYAGWGERIGAVYEKLGLIDSLGLDIKNVLIYIDTDCTFKYTGEVYQSNHYLLTGSTKEAYLVKHFRSFLGNLSIDKIRILLGLTASKSVSRTWESDKHTNDPNHNCSDSIILENYGLVQNDKPYIQKMDSLRKEGFLYSRPSEQVYLEPQISELEKDILYKIKNLFKKHQTVYSIVISPLYDQKKFCSSDMNILEEVFQQNIYDYSGINEITKDAYNYYDRKHFQFYISKNIIDTLVPKVYTETYHSGN